jgi:hypothetical protein
LPNSNVETSKDENKIRLRLETVVDYELNGVSVAELTHYLGKLPFEAYREGMLTMDTLAECTVVSSEVSQVDRSAPCVRDMEKADYLRKAIWAMDDLVKIYPEGTAYQAVRNELSDRLSAEMDKGPKEVKTDER